MYILRLLSKFIVLVIFVHLAYSEYEESEILAVFTYANELGFEPGHANDIPGKINGISIIGPLMVSGEKCVSNPKTLSWNLYRNLHFINSDRAAFNPSDTKGGRDDPQIFFLNNF